MNVTERDQRVGYANAAYLRRLDSMNFGMFTIHQLYFNLNCHELHIPINSALAIPSFIIFCD